MAGVASLLNIQKEAKRLLTVTLSCPVGAQKAVYDSRGGRSYSKILALKRKKDELLNECVETEAEINLLLGGDENLDASEDKSARVRQLKQEITGVKAKYYQDALLLDALKKSQCANRVIFSHKHLESDTSSSELKSMFEQQAEVVTELIRNFKELESAKKEIDKIRAQRSALQIECRKLMSDLQQDRKQRLPDTDETTTLQKMREKLKEMTSRTVLLQHTLQALIGGYTDWAADEELEEFLLSLGTPLIVS